MPPLDHLWLRNWSFKRALSVWIVAAGGAAAILWLQRHNALGAAEDVGFWLLVFLGMVTVTLPIGWVGDRVWAWVERREERLRNEP
jgi:hypothetical protein